MAPEQGGAPPATTADEGSYVPLDPNVAAAVDASGSYRPLEPDVHADPAADPAATAGGDGSYLNVTTDGVAAAAAGGNSYLEMAPELVSASAGENSDSHLEMAPEAEATAAPGVKLTADDNGFGLLFGGARDQGDAAALGGGWYCH